MQICPQCGETFEGAETSCPEDGSPLVKVRPSQAMRQDPFIGRRIKDTYLIKSRLGAGGMGTVYTAVQERLGRVVAIKVLPEHLAESQEAVLRFHREAQSASALTHPNTIIIYDYGQEEDGLLYLAMEFVDGRPLTKLIRQGNLAPRRIYNIMEQICGSLAEAHGKGMIHRDLKPDNIMLTHRGGDDDFVKVLDFGLAKAVGNQGEASSITQTGMVMGTPAYMAPEQIQNLPLSPATDQYALGTIVFEMVTGQIPFQGETSLSICMQHVNDAPPMMHEIYPQLPHNPHLEAVIRRSLAKYPEERFASVTEFLAELKSLLDSDEWRSGSSVMRLPAGSKETTAKASPDPGRPADAHEPLSDGGGKGFPLVPVLVVLLLLLGGGGAAAFFLLGGKQAAPPAAAAAQPDTGPKESAEEAEARAREKRFDAAMEEGRKLFRDKRYAKALEQFDAAAATDAASPMPHEWKGEVYKAQGDREQARSAFERSLRLKEGDIAPSVLQTRLDALLGPEEEPEPPKPTTKRGRRGRRGRGSRKPPKSTGKKKPTIDTAFE